MLHITRFSRSTAATRRVRAARGNSRNSHGLTPFRNLRFLKGFSLMDGAPFGIRGKIGRD